MNFELERKFSVTNNCLDCYNNLKFSSVLDITQEIAGSHADALGVGYDNFIAKNLIWIVLRNYIEVEENVKELKEVDCVTRLVKPVLFQFPRDYEIKSNDKTIIKVRSIWAIYDIKEKKIVVPSEASVLNIENEGFYKRIKKLKTFEKSDLTFVKDFIVNFSYIDHNGHMNNTHVMDLFLDIFEPKKDEIIKNCQIEYVSQSFLNDTLSLYTYVENDDKYLFGYVKDELKFYLKVNFFEK